MNLPVGTSSAFFLDLSAVRSADDLARRLIEAYRGHGHLEAELDPLGLDQGIPVGVLDRLRKDVRAMPESKATVTLGEAKPMTLGALAAELKRIYAGSSALEAAHVDDEEAR